MSLPVQKVSVEGFDSIKTTNLLCNSTYDDLYRVRDLEQNEWRLGRFYIHPIDESKREQLNRSLEGSAKIKHESIIPIKKHVIVDGRLAIFWQYQDGLTLEERLRRDLSPRKIAIILSAVVDGVQAAKAMNVRCEYLNIGDILVDTDDLPYLFGGTFTHLLSGRGDSTASVENYDRRVVNRLGTILLSLAFGRENIELTQAVQLESNVRDLMFRFNDLLDIDPNIMAIIAKCLMLDGVQTYQTIDDLQADLATYLNGRAVALGGVDFHQLIKSWNMRKSGS